MGVRGCREPGGRIPEVQDFIYPTAEIPHLADINNLSTRYPFGVSFFQGIFFGCPLACGLPWVRWVNPHGRSALNIWLKCTIQMISLKGDVRELWRAAQIRPTWTINCRTSLPLPHKSGVGERCCSVFPTRDLVQKGSLQKLISYTEHIE